MKKDTEEWLKVSLELLKRKQSRHKLQDGYYWFICPEEQVDSILVKSIEKVLYDEEKHKQEVKLLHRLEGDKDDVNADIRKAIKDAKKKKKKKPEVIIPPPKRR